LHPCGGGRQGGSGNCRTSLSPQLIEDYWSKAETKEPLIICAHQPGPRHALGTSGWYLAVRSETTASREAASTRSCLAGKPLLGSPLMRDAAALRHDDHADPGQLCPDALVKGPHEAHPRGVSAVAVASRPHPHLAVLYVEKLDVSAKGGEGGLDLLDNLPYALDIPLQSAPIL
jgi:hypothetical protein